MAWHFRRSTPILVLAGSILSLALLGLYREMGYFQWYAEIPDELCPGLVMDQDAVLSCANDCCPILDFLRSEDVLNTLCTYGQPGACVGRRRCSGKTCLNRLPLPCTLPYLSGDSLIHSPHRTSYSNVSVSKAVFTMAAGPVYGPDWITMFVGSLRRTGFDGLIVVFVDAPPSPAFTALLTALDAEYSVFDRDGYPTPILTAIRFLVYLDYLLANEARLQDARILHCDSRDIYFQLDPFLEPWPASVSGYPTPGRHRFQHPLIYPFTGPEPVAEWPENFTATADLVIVIESNSKDHSGSRWNKLFVDSCVPANESSRLVDSQASITNSGSVFGTFAGQKLYLQEMASWYLPEEGRFFEIDDGNGSVRLYSPNVTACIDQGLQSYLVFTGAFDRLFASAHAKGEVAGGVGYFFDEDGPVRMLGLGPAWACGTRVDGNVTWTDGRIMNSVGEVAAIVHQFDRWCGATLHNAWLLGSHEAAEAAITRFARDFPKRSRSGLRLLTCNVP